LLREGFCERGVVEGGLADLLERVDEDDRDQPIG